MTGCEWVEPWRGACAEPCSGRFCDEHSDKSCRSCGSEATRGCSATHGLVCGEPLCDDCDCTWI